MDALVRYPWPGNVRELHFIERAAILSPQSVLRAPTSELEPFQPNKESNAPMNGLAEVERDHILRALEASNWVISRARMASPFQERSPCALGAAAVVNLLLPRYADSFATKIQ